MRTRIPGLKVGHGTDLEGGTGLTVVLCPEGTVGGVDVRGGSPGTRETDLLRPMNQVNYVNAVLLAGGSAFGLSAADGAMSFLAERNIGFPTPAGPVPIVPAAILYDLDVGSASARPTAKMGYEACETASTEFSEGTVGVGTGATVGKILGPDFRMKGGFGAVSEELPGGLLVEAFAAVNAVGDVIGADGRIIAGARSPSGDFLDTIVFLKTGVAPPPSPMQNTALVILATNGKLTKEEANKVAQMAHDGFARSIRPVHTSFDGDTVFSLATGEVDVRVDVVGAIAAEVVTAAIRRAVETAIPLFGIPGLAS
ncbi:MAG: P1 family peptidase [Actinobacteria bacterium]|nr:P1 family peptidase [Actinomycetota bacterium]